MHSYLNSLHLSVLIDGKFSLRCITLHLWLLATMTAEFVPTLPVCSCLSNLLTTDTEKYRKILTTVNFRFDKSHCMFGITDNNNCISSKYVLIICILMKANIKNGLHMLFCNSGCIWLVDQLCTFNCRCFYTCNPLGDQTLGHNLWLEVSSAGLLLSAVML